ncbi:hypothetical protein [Pseudomonas cavernicola]|nr:hypothetical protein [Pseudomonas cavernicola]
MSSLISSLRTSFFTLLFSLLCTAVQAEPAPPSIMDNLMDIDRYLLLYGSTGDERFLERLAQQGKLLQARITEEQNARILLDIWSLYQEQLAKVRQAFVNEETDLKKAVRQSLEVVRVFDDFVLGQEQQASPSLADNLRALALGKVRQASSHLLEKPLPEEDTGKLLTLSETIEAQMASLPTSVDPKSWQNDLRMRWHYLKTTMRDDALLRYPFNSQIEKMLATLSQH